MLDKLLDSNGILEWSILRKSLILHPQDGHSKRTWNSNFIASWGNNYLQYYPLYKIDFAVTKSAVWSETITGFKIDFDYFETKNLNTICFACFLTPSNGLAFPDRFFYFLKLGASDASHK